MVTSRRTRSRSPPNDRHCDLVAIGHIERLGIGGVHVNVAMGATKAFAGWTEPLGPYTVIGAEPRTLPELRTGASIPRKNSSVREISTWLALRSGPNTRTRSISRRGPMSVLCCSDANWPGCDSSYFFVNVASEPKSSATVSSIRWQ